MTNSCNSVTTKAKHPDKKWAEDLNRLSKEEIRLAKKQIKRRSTSSSSEKCKSKPQRGIMSYILEWLLLRKKNRKEMFCVAARNIKRCDCRETGLTAPWKVPVAGTYPKELQPRPHTGIYLYTYTRSGILHSQQQTQPKRPLVNDEINTNTYARMWLSLQRKESSDICCNVDEPWDGRPREISQSQKDRKCMTSLIRGACNNHIHKDRRQGRGGGGEEEESQCLMGRVAAGEKENVLQAAGGDGCTSVWTDVMPLKCTLQCASNGKFCYVSRNKLL